MSTDPAASAAAPPPGWSGRTDGVTAEHWRWHQVVRPVGDPDAGPPPAAPGHRSALGSAPAPPGTASGPASGPGVGASARADAGPGQATRTTALIGFASDEGVRRNHGRVGARSGPAALRAALSPLAYLEGTGALLDAGDVSVERGDDRSPGDLEGGQEELGAHVATLVDRHDLTVVLGGGHETAYGSYRGLAGSGLLAADTRLGILNLDAHFDLREAERPSSGTPFLQVSRDEARAGRRLAYAVVGISEADNTRVLFDRAGALGARWLTDEQSQSGDLAAVRDFVREFAASVDVLHLSIDLDVLPAAVAPGVSAPAGFGVPFEVIHACALEATTSGRLALAEVVELNPDLDPDRRTARAAARLVHTIVSHHVPRAPH